MHPYQEHRATKVEHARVGHIAGFAAGGEVKDRDSIAVAKDDKRQELDHMRARGGRAVEGRKLVKMFAEHEKKEAAEGYARGGRTKGKGKGNTHVNVIVAGHGGQPPATPPMAGAGVPGVAPPPPRPVAPAPAVMPPAVGGPPPGPPMLPPGLGGLGPRRSGGRAYARGGGVKDGPAWTESMNARKKYVLPGGNNKQDGPNIGRGKPITYKTGGPVEVPSGYMGPKFTGGGHSGMGRLQKAHRAARKHG